MVVMDLLPINMAAYKNDYTKAEDECLLELHEVRHSLDKDLAKKSVNEINKTGLALFSSWKKESAKSELIKSR